MAELTYKRVLLKLSGEALAGEQKTGIDPETVGTICKEIGGLLDMGVELALVIGGGNIFRGLSGSAKGMERSSADYMGMLATVLNAAKFPDAVKYDSLSYDETLSRHLGVMDAAAFALVRDNNVPIIVCRMLGGDIRRAILGEQVGTIVHDC